MRRAQEEIVGDGTTIGIPKTLRDRIDTLAARETLRTGKRVTKADVIEKLVKREESRI